ncbi:bifunctional 4-hydroxy-2-oxoglutarate aldolase/2-dehydro-3-deoxy-phosphogluconate aldolase [Microbacterium sp. Marseille-Q6965]|uniref:bifunctional 4-hydroxy-2-oxoglutarate aldolase/2-dehydro-3-deoxy-phosphogluconate aldolase n=1 Tax=Microbacterium sp. Marseille-Q6965 TaxID=2965072 RepID=UPI0021B731B6|nr:bifunctional 4-hydroxy-2-oxoglutarate aldolase/2-dehydro-3-deoxy-phosphogluconate aldolase [Microbacterium sp. Marseille-Q6965]
MSGIAFEDLFARTPVMAILRGYTTERTLELTRLAWSVGVSGVEVPIQSPQGIEALEVTAAAARDAGRAVGAGTVVSVEHVRVARAAGAAFTVAPGFDPDVARASLDAGMPHLPGVATGTEIQAAARFGLGWLKAFPASVLGSPWFTAMRGPFPQVRLVATGGITARNAEEYLRSGADAVAVGSALEDESQLPLLAGLAYAS